MAENFHDRWTLRHPLSFVTSGCSGNPQKNIRGIEAVSNIINNDISTREERFRGQLKAVENRLAVSTNYVDCLSKIQLIISSDEDLKDFEWIYYR